MWIQADSAYEFEKEVDRVYTIHCTGVHSIIIQSYSGRICGRGSIPRAHILYPLMWTSPMGNIHRARPSLRPERVPLPSSSSRFVSVTCLPGSCRGFSYRTVHTKSKSMNLTSPSASKRIGYCVFASYQRIHQRAVRSMQPITTLYMTFGPKWRPGVSGIWASLISPCDYSVQRGPQHMIPTLQLYQLQLFFSLFTVQKTEDTSKIMKLSLLGYTSGK